MEIGALNGLFVLGRSIGFIGKLDNKGIKITVFLFVCLLVGWFYLIWLFLLPDKDLRYAVETSLNSIYKNILCKNIEVEICELFRIIQE